jgi:ABC-type glycerol-3-phosphate transport system substrate-binding protein
VPLQEYSNYDAAVMAGASNKEAAARFVKFVTSKSAAALWNATNVKAVCPEA